MSLFERSPTPSSASADDAQSQSDIFEPATPYYGQRRVRCTVCRCVVPDSERCRTEHVNGRGHRFATGHSSPPGHIDHDPWLPPVSRRAPLDLSGEPFSAVRSRRSRGGQGRGRGARGARGTRGFPNQMRGGAYFAHRNVNPTSYPHDLLSWD